MTRNLSIKQKTSWAKNSKNTTFCLNRVYPLQHGLSRGCKSIRIFCKYACIYLYANSILVSVSVRTLTLVYLARFHNLHAQITITSACSTSRKYFRSCDSKYNSDISAKRRTVPTNRNFKESDWLRYIKICNFLRFIKQKFHIA